MWNFWFLLIWMIKFCNKISNFIEYFWWNIGSCWYSINNQKHFLIQFCFVWKMVSSRLWSSSVESDYTGYYKCFVGKKMSVIIVISPSREIFVMFMYICWVLNIWYIVFVLIVTKVIIILTLFFIVHLFYYDTWNQ